MYRTIETSTWNDPKILQLDQAGKLLWVYLLTNRHSHMSGIYYLPCSLITEEIGIPEKRLDTLWDTLSSLELSWYEKKTHIVFVKNMFRYQGRGDKNFRAAANNIRTLHNSLLINKFVDTYPEICKYGINRVSDRVSDRDSRVGIQEQEQEQEQDKKLLVASQPCEIGKRCNGDFKSCHDQFDRLWAEYPRHRPGITECRKAWCKQFSSGQDIEKILQWIRKAKPQWNDPKFIPHLTTFLNARYWEGDLPLEAKVFDPYEKRNKEEK